MFNRNTTFQAAALLLGLIGAAPAAHASSHREALAILSDPCVDNTDVYAWVTPGTHDKLYLIAGYNGLHEPGQGNQQTRLCDDVLYEFHITRGAGPLEDALTYQIRFSSTRPKQVDTTDLAAPPGGGKELLYQLGGVVQTYEVWKVEGGKRTRIAKNVPVAPANVGPYTDRIAYHIKNTAYDPNSWGGAVNETPLYDDAFAATFITPMGNNGDEGRVWSGTRDDGFYLDEKGIFDVLNLHPHAPGQPGIAEDVFAGFNLNVIALEVPVAKVSGTGAVPTKPGNDSLIGVWASASRRKFRILRANGEDCNYGPWVQVGREGLPLINAGVIGVQDQGKYLRTKPVTDVANFGAYFLNPILVRDAEFLGIYKALGVPSATVQSLKSGRTDILKAINLDNFPSAGAHSVMIAPGVTGDVLRLDLATDSRFPNGRSIPGGAQPNQEQVDVSDVLISLILSGQTSGLGDGVDHNDKPYLTEFPWLALPWQGLNQGHGATASP